MYQMVQEMYQMVQGTELAGAPACTHEKGEHRTGSQAAVRIGPATGPSVRSAGHSPMFFAMIVFMTSEVPP